LHIDDVYGVNSDLGQGHKNEEAPEAQRFLEQYGGRYWENNGQELPIVEMRLHVLILEVLLWKARYGMAKKWPNHDTLQTNRPSSSAALISCKMDHQMAEKNAMGIRLMEKIQLLFKESGEMIRQPEREDLWNMACRVMETVVQGVTHLL
jgi:hypothetical protein